MSTANAYPPNLVPAEMLNWTRTELQTNLRASLDVLGKIENVGQQGIGSLFLEESYNFIYMLPRGSTMTIYNVSLLTVYRLVRFAHEILWDRCWTTCAL